MPDPAERFIEAAVRPLADNPEMQMLAAQELRAAMEKGPEGVSDASLEQATANLEKAPSKRHWKTYLYAAALVAAIFAAIPVARDYMRLRLASWALFAMTDSWAVALPGPPFEPDVIQQVPGLFGPLTASERLLLFGDLSQPSKAEAMRRLWDSSPEDPALFADYARACTSKQSLPVDFLKTADRLDPQNAWFRYLAAGVTAYKSVEARRSPTTSSSGIRMPRDSVS
ncbi:hypothetical protein OKA05_09905 [Luteolibacter arcticus]|uniref:Uncharacterized protein n=1 Tax=Luteolibacter arcticus TaxID=1581411 RepID=A0ABT3GH10_9BACT|nr:hypothetical protein [Luteolibacter arcticus]MCW1922864.1 hypothetical protein [Luteolibacter arcticus]